MLENMNMLENAVLFLCVRSVMTQAEQKEEMTITTGCKIVSDKKYLFPIQARNHHMSWARCLFFPLILGHFDI